MKWRLCFSSGSYIRFRGFAWGRIDLLRINRASIAASDVPRSAQYPRTLSAKPNLSMSGVGMSSGSRALSVLKEGTGECENFSLSLLWAWLSKQTPRLGDSWVDSLSHPACVGKHGVRFDVLTMDLEFRYPRHIPRRQQGGPEPPRLVPVRTDDAPQEVSCLAESGAAASHAQGRERSPFQRELFTGKQLALEEEIMPRTSTKFQFSIAKWA
jgi:hypothetical protein